MAKSLVVDRRWCRTGSSLSQARPDGSTRPLGSTHPCCNACFGELCRCHRLDSEQGAISRGCASATVEQHTLQVQGTEGKATWFQPEQWTIIVHNINSDQCTLVLRETSCRGIQPTASGRDTAKWAFSVSYTILRSYTFIYLHIRAYTCNICTYLLFTLRHLCPLNLHTDIYLLTGIPWHAYTCIYVQIHTYTSIYWRRRRRRGRGHALTPTARCIRVLTSMPVTSTAAAGEPARASLGCGLGRLGVGRLEAAWTSLGLGRGSSGSSRANLKESTRWSWPAIIAADPTGVGESDWLHLPAAEALETEPQAFQVHSKVAQSGLGWTATHSGLDTTEPSGSGGREPERSGK